MEPKKNTNDLKVLVVMETDSTEIGGHLNCAFEESRSKGSTKSLTSMSSGPLDRFRSIIATLEAAEEGALFDGADLEDEALVQVSVAKVPKRDFVSEIRPEMDVKHCFEDMTVLLDLEKTSLGDIVQELVEQIVAGRESINVVEDVKSALYVDHESCIFGEAIQGVYEANDGRITYDQSWLIALCTVPSVKKRRVGMVRLRHPVNFGTNAHEVKFFILIVAPTREKMTKSAAETGRTIATIFADINFRHKLSKVNNKTEFISTLAKRSQDLASPLKREPKEENEESCCRLGFGLWENITRRGKFYISDFTDGVVGDKSISKSLSAILFLYFATILPCIAFGELMDKNTKGKIDADRALIGQAVGGLVWAIFAGQPLVIIATTALVSLYTKVVFEISDQLEVDFYTMYALVGLWNTLFVVIYSVFGISTLIRFATRSVEEIFAMFIVVCFAFDALKDTIKNYTNFYYSEACSNETIASMLENSSHSNNSALPDVMPCQRETSLLFLVLMLGTLWLSISVYEFKDTPYLSAAKRELFSDYALPIGVIAFSLIGNLIFFAVPVETLDISSHIAFERATIQSVSVSALAASAGLGFALSLLFFMDQNITGQIVNSPTNKLKKGSAAHLDILCIGLINCFLSLYGLPWMHGVLPHSPLHVRCLADVEERVDEGHLHQVVIKVRETRITGIVCHLLIGLSVYYVSSVFSLIPVPVLDGLFLYCAIASLRGNSFFERVTLLFTEQSSYPPNHYIRRCPQKKMHFFTLCEVIQLGILCFISYCPWAYVQMAFPLFIALLIPIRHFLIPILVEKKHLDALDSYH